MFGCVFTAIGNEPKRASYAFKGATCTKIQLINHEYAKLIVRFRRDVTPGYVFRMMPL